MGINVLKKPSNSIFHPKCCKQQVPTKHSYLSTNLQQHHILEDSYLNTVFSAVDTLILISFTSITNLEEIRNAQIQFQPTQVEPEIK
jgi:hypothetical protein